MGMRITLLSALLAMGAVALTAEDAQAFWGSRGSWGSYGGSWGSSGSSGGSWGSSGGSWGSSGGSWGSSGGSYGGCNSCGGLFRRHRLRHGSSGGSSGGSNGGSSGGYSYYGYNGGGYVVSNRSSYGSASYDSAPTLATAKPAPAKTSLTVHVPADAKVTLAGVRTKQTGEVREFATNRLAAGQTWSNYNVHVEITRDGKTMSQDRTILLTGGQSQELSFDLGGMQLASKD